MTNTTKELECDYLIIGAGAASLAFVDTLLTELPDSKLIIVDQKSTIGRIESHAVMEWIKLRMKCGLLLAVGRHCPEKKPSNEESHHRKNTFHVLNTLDHILRWQDNLN